MDLVNFINSKDEISKTPSSPYEKISKANSTAKNSENKLRY